MSLDSTEPRQEASEAEKEASKFAPTGRFERLPGVLTRLEAIRSQNPGKLGLFKRVYEGTATRQQCVKAMCLDCVGFRSAAVRDCGDRLCPLWKFRPFQRK
jgi:hypothetical protein